MSDIYHFSLLRRKNLCRLCVALMVCVLSAVFVLPVFAQPLKAPVLIRDTEIESVLKLWATPVIKASGLDPQAINIVLVQNRDLNAFVAGGQNVFIYTGLLEESDKPSEVIGVLAHELGHIRGGHLVRVKGAWDNASYESMLGAILGIGAAIATGNGQVGAAVATGTQATALNKFLSFSRVQESSADQAALDYLEKAGVSPGGIVDFMKKMESQELLPASQQNEYVRTHPLTQNRLSALKAGYDRSQHKEIKLPAMWQEQHDRILAKLKGYISPERVQWDYDSNDKSMAAEYARAIAAYRQNHVEESLTLIDGLLEREIDNPYFLELKAQMLFEYGRVEESLPYYKKSVEILPNASLIRVAYAHALVESTQNNNQRLDEAIGHLDRAIRDEARSSRAYRLLATAYGRKKNDPMARLFLAEEALLKNDADYAKKQAEAALAGLEEGSRYWIRAQDILSYIEQSGKKG